MNTSSCSRIDRSTTPREQVSNELRQVLQEKENALDEAAGLFREAESVHSARMEAVLSEKADIEADFEVNYVPKLFFLLLCGFVVLMGFC